MPAPKIVTICPGAAELGRKVAAFITAATVGTAAAPVDTASVTLTVCVLFGTPGAIIVTVPEYVRASRPAGLTEMERLAGEVPAAGVTDNQLALVAVALKFRLDPPPATEIVCGVGRVEPI
jgi:hypothetical protein